MSDPYLGEIRIVSFQFAPKGWAQCNGQLLSIQQNSALFAILGTTYGGNGINNFQLPNFQGRIPMHWGTNYVIGESGGEESHTLITNELPTHSHTAHASSAVSTLASPSGNVWGDSPTNPFSTSTPNANLMQASVTNAGGSQPHENRSPFLVLNFVIAMVGIFPSRS